MNAPYRSPAITLETDRQWLRRLISSFRHDSTKAPWEHVEWRAYNAAVMLDNAEERRWCLRMAESRPAIFDDELADHLYTTERNQRDIARSIYAGGE